MCALILRSGNYIVPIVPIVRLFLSENSEDYSSQNALRTLSFLQTLAPGWYRRFRFRIFSPFTMFDVLETFIWSSVTGTGKLCSLYSQSRIGNHHPRRYRSTRLEGSLISLLPRGCRWIKRHRRRSSVGRRQVDYGGQHVKKPFQSPGNRFLDSCFNVLWERLILEKMRRLRKSQGKCRRFGFQNRPSFGARASRVIHDVPSFMLIAPRSTLIWSCRVRVFAKTTMKFRSWAVVFIMISSTESATVCEIEVALTVSKSLSVLALNWFTFKKVNSENQRPKLDFNRTL